MSDIKGKRELIITIDGPSGAGKSTIAKGIARSMGYQYIDTGAMYRGIAYAFRAKNVSIEDIEKFLEKLSIRFDFDDKAKVFLDGEEITEGIRDPDISMLASKLSQNVKVRNYLTIRQREAGAKGGVVLEGRDTGSVVFPDAHIKFYLDASHDERAKRRYKELHSLGIGDELTKVKEDMLKRDENDSKRAIAPLVVPDGAVYVDTTGMEAKDVLDRLLNYIKEAGV